MGVGKSTAADYLTSRGFVKIKMAAPLKAMLKSIGLTDEHIEGHLKEEPCEMLYGKTPRYAMQTLGTEWGRGLIHNNLWTSLWLDRVLKAHRAGLDVVCDDVRFPNEAEAVRSIGGVIVGLTREGHARSEEHESELIDISPDIKLHNGGDLQHLVYAVHALSSALDKQQSLPL